MMLEAKWLLIGTSGPACLLQKGVVCILSLYFESAFKSVFKFVCVSH